jgi:hypothetical protein
VNFLKTIFFSLLLLSQVSFAQTINHWENIVDASDVWKYKIPASELPANWTDSEFDDLSWSSGQGGIGYGDNDDRTIITANTLSVFIRKTFTLSDPASLDTAILFIDYDDAFVAYLNGIEIARANIGTPEIRPAFNANANSIVEPNSVSGKIPSIFPIRRDKLISALKTGNNTLAIQVHNQATSSSDLSSTTYFLGGFSSYSADFRSPPTWFSFSSNLPLVIIDTWGGTIMNEPKIDAWIKVVNKGLGQINSSNDPATDFEGNIGIEVRGQSSQMFPKQGYGFETRNQLKEDSSINLIGMPDESDWILSAPYSDKTMMRNPMTYYLGRSMGRWQVRTQWCELIINGDYLGVYLLEEKIKRDKDRVNIDKLLPADLKADSVTGGYIVKVDKLDGLTLNDYFRTIPVYSYSNARHYDFTYVYPKAEDLMPAQKTYIKGFLTEFESALNSTKYQDPVNGFRKYIDVNSFIDFQIIQELSNNVDGYRYSTFFHKENIVDGGKLIAGPLWDFDLCYGNVDYSPPRLATDQWLYPTFGPNEGYAMHWWARLMQDPLYTKAVKLRYSKLRLGPLNTDSIMAYLDSNQALLGEAINRNFERWPILDQYVWPNPYVGNSYDNEMDYLKTWITDRLIWMDTKWLTPLGNEYMETEYQIFNAYPNPFNSKLNLTVKPFNLENITADVYTIQGRKMISRTYKPSTISSVDFVLENISLPSGIYFLRVHQSGKILGSGKIICSGEY